MSRELTSRLIALRKNHAAWLLLAARQGPLILASLKSLTDAHPNGVELEIAVEHLAATLADHANDPDFESGDDFALAARRELRHWVRRGLAVERHGKLLATDALQRSLHFLASLEEEGMTSTASRLATVQRAIENLHAQLSPSQAGREAALVARPRLHHRGGLAPSNVRLGFVRSRKKSIRTSPPCFGAQVVGPLGVRVMSPRWGLF